MKHFEMKLNFLVYVKEFVFIYRNDGVTSRSMDNTCTCNQRCLQCAAKKKVYLLVTTELM